MNASEAMVSDQVNLTFFKWWCNANYGGNIWPDVDAINKEFGGRNLNSSRTFLVNGSEDPWQWASNTDFMRGPITSYLVDCTDCGHCVDLSPISTSDSLNLTQTRALIAANITGWLNNPSYYDELYY
mmetsp:Transcript_32570/g.29427  ORF Transcript_32570/g.29427 Transcript_32570/m.29427 type:complete len:127 (+) Transcript_32570:1081-1461(+)